ncbi:hypothetical protein LUZ60_016394 [Juncus effusus]|nr:hypothetical protein LUZ60_016394 [Juncus effusus]
MATSDDHLFFHMHHLMSNNKGKNDRKRRFNEDQIKSLESMFQNQTKLEPKQKIELARELGLQPRQVSIWFQNKRARWKSKQLEKEYNILQSNYEALLKNVTSLRNENQILVKQMERLKEMVEQYSSNETNPSCKNEEVGEIKNEMEEIKSFGGDDNLEYFRLIEQEHECDLDYGSYQDQLCTSSACDLWDCWPATELNLVA